VVTYCFRRGACLKEVSCKETSEIQIRPADSMSAIRVVHLTVIVRSDLKEFKERKKEKFQRLSSFPKLFLLNHYNYNS